jgi:uncharacterized membrane protein (DUF373 family)
MKLLDHLKPVWHRLAQYERFEQVVLRFILAILAVMIIYTLVLVVLQLADDFWLGTAFMDKAVLQDAFGSILTVLILLEFGHSIAVAVARRSGAIQVRIVVLIVVLVIARKLMLLDYATTELGTLFGYGGLLFILGAVYWLISDGDRRREASSPVAKG